MEQIMDYENTILDIKAIIDLGRNAAYSAVSKSMVLTYWNIGKRIVEEEQKGKSRAKYGKRLLDVLTVELIKENGNGYSARNLRNYRLFYLRFPREEIWNACVPNVKWTYFRSLLRVDDEEARIWYMNEA